MLKKLVHAMGARNDHQATIGAVNVLHGCPGTHNAVSRAEGEVVQVLVHGVARCPGAYQRYLCMLTKGKR